MRLLLLAVVAAAAVATQATAQDRALVLSVADYDRLPDIRDQGAAEAAADLLSGAGFDVIEVRDPTFTEAAEVLAEFRRGLLTADRVVVYLAGHYVNDAGQSWLLTAGAREPDAFNVGGIGVPLDPVLAMLGRHQARTAVLIADDTGRLVLGTDLSTGPAAIEPPQGVTVFVGPSGGILDVLGDGLLDPGRSLASVAAGLPPSVTATGFLSRSVAFLPATSGTPPATARPLPEPVQSAEAVEAALGLTRDERRSVQRDLEILGFDPRGIDGIFGPGTRAAIRAWQTRNGFDASGFLSGNQLVRLQEQGARRAEELEAEAAARQAEQDRRDVAFWEETGAGGTEAGLRTYLERYPDGLYASVARERLRPFDEARLEQAARAEREAWDSAVAADTPEAYQAYIAAYPQGTFRAQAEERIARLGIDRGSAQDRAEEDRVAGNPVVRLLIERRLQQLGEDPGTLDGVFDEATRRAIRRFQRARDLPATGYVSQATMARLLAG